MPNQKSLQCLLVVSTVPTLHEARKLTHVLLAEKVAACVNLIPRIESHYRWQGKLETSKEIMLLIKTRAVHFPRLEEIIRRRHSYKTPEIIALRLDRISGPYLKWLLASTLKSKSKS